MNAKVSLIRCNKYELALVKQALTESIKNLGGLEKYIKKGEKVLLKVNLLIKKSPEVAATTHPVFVQALCELLMEFGASVVIGDSPGGPFNEKALAGIYKVTGMEQVATATGAKLNSNYKFAERSNPNGLLLKQLTVTDMLNDVDKVISVSKLKTHGMMVFTGAVKNMFGTVPGIMKAEYHLNMPQKPTFANALIDICLCANPVLSFMDGIIGMEGNGPSGGTPRHVNVVIASDSPYHLDKVASRIINLEHKDVYTIKNCIDRGICSEGFDDIEFSGSEIESFKIKDFEIPETIWFGDMMNVPPFLKKFLNKYVQPRPLFDFNTCISCGICADNCPAKIIDMTSKKPVVDLEKCIRCYCCQELCPQKAVTVHRPSFLKSIVNK